MRIGFLIFHNIDGKGGLETVLTKTISQFNSLGVESHLFFWEAPRYETFLEHFPHHYIINNQKPQDYRIGNKFKLPFYKLWRRKRVQKYKNQQMLHFLKDTALPLNLDILIIIDLPDTLIYVKSALNFYQKKSKSPIASWIHGSIKLSTAKQISRIKKLLPLFSAHFTVSSGISRELKQLYQIDNSYNINNPVDEAPLFPRNTTPYNFLYMGRLGDPRKQVDRLLSALTKLQGEWLLHIFGSAGSFEQDVLFHNRIQELNLQSHIKHYGWIDSPWDKMKQETFKADLLLLNSSSEGFGLVLVEAMMRGIPCIASNCPVGPQEIIQHEKNGWLYEVGHEEKLISILQRIIQSEISLPSRESVQRSVLHYRTIDFINNFYLLIKIIIKHNAQLSIVLKPNKNFDNSLLRNIENHSTPQEINTSSKEKSL